MKTRFYVCIAACFVIFLISTFLITSEPSGKATAATRRSSPGRTTSGRQKKKKKVSHCGDNPPANPSNCNINRKFDVGCDLPWDGGESHEVDKHCPNEGCATREQDKAQNKIKNNLCATGTPVQISFTSIDKLQRAVDKKVQQGQLTYGSTGPPLPADRAKLKGLTTVDVSNHAVTLGEGDLVTLDAFVLD